MWSGCFSKLVLFFSFVVWLLVGLLPELVGGWGQMDKSRFGWLGRSTVSPLGYISLGKVGLAGSGSQVRTGPRLDVIDALYFPFVECAKRYYILCSRCYIWLTCYNGQLFGYLFIIFLIVSKKHRLRFSRKTHPMPERRGMNKSLLLV